MKLTKGRRVSELVSSELASSELASSELASSELASSELASSELVSSELVRRTLLRPYGLRRSYLLESKSDTLFETHPNIPFRPIGVTLVTIAHSELKSL